MPPDNGDYVMSFPVDQGCQGSSSDCQTITTVTNNTAGNLDFTNGGSAVTLLPNDTFVLNSQTTLDEFYQTLSVATPESVIQVSPDASTATTPSANPLMSGASLSPTGSQPIPPNNSDSGKLQGTVQVPENTINIDLLGTMLGWIFNLSSPSRSGQDLAQNVITSNDPVNTFTGSFQITHDDILIPGGGFDLSLRRVYDSQALFAGPFGWNWDHNHNQFIREIGSIGTPSAYGRWSGVLHEDVFTTQDGVFFNPPSGVFDYFEKNPALGIIYQVTKPGGLQFQYGLRDGLYPTRVWLTSIVDRFGNQLKYDYDAQFRLVSVTDQLSLRRLTFEYGDCGLLEHIYDDHSNEWKYYHDPDLQHLIGAEHPSTPDYPTGYTTTYTYWDDMSADQLLVHAIVAVTDGDGNTYIQNEYESDPSSGAYAKVIAQIADQYAYQYEYTPIQYTGQNPRAWNIQAAVTAVQMPDGGVRSYTFNYRGDLLEERIRLAKDGSYKVLVTTYQYDYFGNLTQIIYPFQAGAAFPATLTMIYNSPSVPIGIPPSPPPDVRNWGLLLSVTLSSTVAVESLTLWRGAYDPSTQLLTDSWEMYPAGADPTKFHTQYTYTSGFMTGVIYPVVLLPDFSSQAATVAITESSVVPGRILRMTSLLSGASTGRSVEHHYGNTSGTEAYKRLIEVVGDPTGLSSLTQIGYDPANYGLPSGVTDPTGVKKVFVFNSQYKVESITLPTVGTGTGKITFHYDSDGFLVEVESPIGSYTGVISGSTIRTLIQRDVHREVSQILLGSNTVSSHLIGTTSNYQGLNVSTIDPDLKLTNRVFDERGLMLSEQSIGVDGSLSPMIKRTYDERGSVKSVYDAGTSGSGIPFNASTYAYDGYQRLKVATDSRGNYTAYSYNWADHSAGVSAPNYGIEDNNPLIQMDSCDASNMLYARSIWEYDKRGRLLQRRIANFAPPIAEPATALTYLTTQYVYDIDNNLISTIGPRGEITTNLFDSLNRLVKTTDPILPTGNTKEFTYDLSGRLLTLDINDLNSAHPHQIWSNDYTDPRGRLKSQSSPDGVTVIYDYDDRDLLVTTHLPATFDDVARQVTKQFGVLGELLSFTDELGQVSSWSYDKCNRIAQFTDPSLASTFTTYDALGRLLKTTYPGGSWTALEYDSHGRPSKESKSFGVSTQMSYFENGLLQKLQVASGGLAAVPDHNFAYDCLNRMITASAGSFTVGRTYDSLGRLTDETSGTSHLSQSYADTLGQINRVWSGLTPRTEIVSLDFNGTVKSIILPFPLPHLFNATTLNGPDAIGAASMNAGVIGLTASYDMQKRLFELDYTSPGDVENLKYRYDSRNRRRVEVLHSSSATFADQWSKNDPDSKNRLVATTSTATPITAMMPTVSSQTDHNNDIQLNVEPALVGSPATGYAYDNGDARKLYTDPITSFTNFYAADSEHKFVNSSIETFSYLADGSRSMDGTRHYDVDGWGRIIKIYDQLSPQTLEISYDALGRPVRLDDGVSPFRELAYFGSELLEEVVAGMVDRQYTVHPQLGRIATSASGGPFWHLYDARQNLIATLDNSGSIRELIRYDEFGFPSTTALGPSSGIEPMFGGMRYLNIPGTSPGVSPVSNWPSGPYLGMFRLYDPSNGVWMSADPMGYIDGPNRFAYVGQNPMDAIDSLGLSKRDSTSTAADDGSTNRKSLGSPTIVWGSEVGSEKLTVHRRSHPRDPTTKKRHVVESIVTVKIGPHFRQAAAIYALELENKADYAKSEGVWNSKDTFGLSPMDIVTILEKAGVQMSNKVEQRLAKQIEANLPLIIGAFKDAGIYTKQLLIGTLANIFIEEGRHFAPIPEGGGSKTWYQPWYGRGYFQLTHEETYDTYGQSLGIDLLNNPDLALDPFISSRLTGLFVIQNGLDHMANESEWKLFRGVTNGMNKDHTEFLNKKTARFDDFMNIVNAFDAALPN